MVNLPPLHTFGRNGSRLGGGGLAVPPQLKAVKE